MHPSGHFRRFKGYDYERGAAMFISFNVEPKCRVLGSIDGNGVLTLNEYGRIVEEKLLESAAQYDDRIRLHSHIVMPNHVHLRIYIRPGQKDALAVLARMILSIKMSTRMTVNRHGFPAFAWERQYHDILCLSQESINAADRYIALNPLKYALLASGAMGVAEPVTSQRLGDGSVWWRAMGETDFLQPDRHIVAFRLSRSISASQYEFIAEQCLARVPRGAVAASTFISPCERELFRRLCEVPDVRILRLAPCDLGMQYRPTSQETDLFAARRFCILTRSDCTGCTRGSLQLLNQSLRALATEYYYEQ